MQNLGARLTVFPDFRELDYRPRTIAVGDQMERRHQELRFGEDVRDLRSVAAIRSSGVGQL